jgi:hypothetical protein
MMKDVADELLVDDQPRKSSISTTEKRAVLGAVSCGKYFGYGPFYVI